MKTQDCYNVYSYDLDGIYQVGDDQDEGWYSTRERAIAAAQGLQRADPTRGHRVDLNVQDITGLPRSPEGDACFGECIESTIVFTTGTIGGDRDMPSLVIRLQEGR